MTLSKRERSFRVTCSDFRGCKNAVYARVSVGHRAVCLPKAELATSTPAQDLRM